MNYPSFVAKYCKDTFYVYIDSRSYDYFTSNYMSLSNANGGGSPTVYAFAEDSTIQEGQVRPYWSDFKDPTSAASLNQNAPIKNKNKPMNQTSFQLLCAGQD